MPAANGRIPTRTQVTVTLRDENYHQGATGHTMQRSIRLRQDLRCLPHLAASHKLAGTSSQEPCLSPYSATHDEGRGKMVGAKGYGRATASRKAAKTFSPSISPGA